MCVWRTKKVGIFVLFSSILCYVRPFLLRCRVVTGLEFVFLYTPFVLRFIYHFIWSRQWLKYIFSCEWNASRSKCARVRMNGMNEMNFEAQAIDRNVTKSEATKNAFHRFARMEPSSPPGIRVSTLSLSTSFRLSRFLFLHFRRRQICAIKSFPLSRWSNSGDCDAHRWFGHERTWTWKSRLSNFIYFVCISIRLHSRERSISMQYSMRQSNAVTGKEKDEEEEK